MSTWNQPDVPFLFVPQAYELWLELRSITKPEKDLKELIDYLDVSTLLLRMAMGVEDFAGRPTAAKGRQEKATQNF